MRPYNRAGLMASPSPQVAGKSSALLASGSKEERAASRAVHRSSWAMDALLSLLLLLLVLEWLYPLVRLADITELYSIRPFVGTFAFFVGLDTLRRSPWGTWLLKACWMILFSVWLHYGQSFPTMEVWAEWARELSRDAAEGIRGELGAWEPSTRTLLFIAGWSFFISVLQSLVLERRQVHGFVLLTLALPVVLQTAFGLDAFAAMGRCLVFGLLLQLLLQPGRYRRRLRDNGSEAELPPDRTARSGKLAWLYSGMLVASLVVALGMFGSLLHPQQAKTPEWTRYWEAWQARFHDIFGLAGEEAAARSGYGTDDSSLGRPLKQDDRLAFTAATDRLTYWRGETKSVYTGQGWTEPDAKGEALAETETLAPHVQTEGFATVRQSIALADSSLNRLLFAGGALTRIVALQSAEGRPIPVEWVRKHNDTDRFSLPAMTEPLSSYTVESRLLTYRALLKLPSQTEIPEDVRERYTKLPDSVPARVGELARRITQGAASDHAKAEAVERYLREHYAYDTVHTRPAEAGEDVVDRFLFEQGAGYCDHFSTAMVVLLREVGVPARWVKGFAPGEVVDQWTEGSDTRYTVQVKQKDAHAWVEVYSADYGWVSYEPTPGYDGAAGRSAEALPMTDPAAPDTRLTPQEGGSWRRMGATGGWSLAWQQLRLQAERTAEGLARLGEEIQAIGAQLLPLLRDRPWWLTAGAVSVSGLGAVTAALRLGQLRRGWSKPAGWQGGAEAEVEGRAGSLRDGRGLFHGLRLLASHRHGERVWRRVQRRYGRAKPFQTLREYAATRMLPGAGQREAFHELMRLLEKQRYADPYGDQGGMSGDMLREAWRKLRRIR
ncbi:transglutaminase family protein [Paenibacillus puerhi]|uniref:transglutaminase family protein n=1 Tax=Paenibacillus puerhi TaxID=2692622 RepID=UPI001358C435|nr:transglutaminase domain-containing protein [Paenibacillus puerhi]